MKDLGALGDGCNDDTVEIRLFNTAVASAQPADASGTWWVTAGNGPHAGDAQIV